jgi:hypothetical protein
MQKLLQLDELYQAAYSDRQKRGEDQNQVHEPQALWGPWMWRGYYYLNKKSQSREVKDLAQELKKQEFTNMPLFGLAARWALLKART